VSNAVPDSFRFMLNSRVSLPQLTAPSGKQKKKEKDHNAS
jgi:hypothetical protein